MSLPIIKRMSIIPSNNRSDSCFFPDLLMGLAGFGWEPIIAEKFGQDTKEGERRHAHYIQTKIRKPFNELKGMGMDG
ncbi:unnamed protein product [Strongylus vulgaris]|uniref:Uncharacterized protein n=1 Tax=Strongylus vulgaris TaxID=40348 RepID=A0A3P7J7S1_STRVU|nr:unnamed protein product [Strongylus vulgaris]